jgi:MFS transporter, putative metabolite transport protein
MVDDARVECRDGRHVVSYSIAIPYFGWMWRPLVARRARAVEAALDAGRPLPSRVPWWAPPVPTDARVRATIACLCLLSGTWSYAGGTGGLLTETLPYAAKVYDVSDRTLGAGLAVVRVGVVLAIALGLLADRVGRRRFVIVAAVAHCLLASVIGLAPSFAVYIGAHLLLRCVDTALAVAIAVLAVEAVPAGNRALMLALVLLSGGIGTALAVLSLPIAAAGRVGFAVVYALQLLALPLVLGAGRRLPESRRFLRHRREPHHYREVLGRRYRGRFVLLGGTSLLSAAFFAPGVEFFTRYLDDTHHFSSVKIVTFLAITAAPSAIGVIAGGRLADRLGRRLVGAPLGALSAVAAAGFYLSGGVWLWPLSLCAALLGAASGAALSPYGSELFPTRVRAGANTLLVFATVCGSAIGLGTAGVLAGPLGIGPAIAVLAVGPLVTSALVWLAFPETARRELEETSGEAPVAA